MRSREVSNYSLGLLMSDQVTDGISYTEVSARYSNSLFGAHQAQQPLRYSQHYGYDPTLMLKDLGDDVHPVRHMSHTHRKITVPLIAGQIWDGRERFSPQQISGLRLAAEVHDIGECEHISILEAVGATVGDVFYEAKQRTDSETERQIRAYLYGQLYPDLPEELLEQAEDTIDSDNSFHGFAFETVERVGYYQTAMRAGETALRLIKKESETPRFQRLAQLALRVSQNHSETLRGRAGDFPYVGRIMNQRGPLEARIHQTLPQFIDTQQAA